MENFEITKDLQLRFQKRKPYAFEVSAADSTGGTGGGDRNRVASMPQSRGGGDHLAASRAWPHHLQPPSCYPAMNGHRGPSEGPHPPPSNKPPDAPDVVPLFRLGLFRLGHTTHGSLAGRVPGKHWFRTGEGTRPGTKEGIK